MSWSFKKINLGVDIHSHLIPGIDDGAQTLEQSIEMIDLLSEAGFRKLITTPHIHPRYPNSNDLIMKGLDSLRTELHSSGNNIEVEAAAEYYVDDEFIRKIHRKEKFLSFGNHYILIECSFYSKPLFFESVILDLKELGYNPVFAHPERYNFLDGDIRWLHELKRTGVLFQVTLGSLGGYYGKKPKKMGIEMIKNGMVDFLGSDLHKSSQVEYLKIGLKSRAVQTLLKSGKLLNKELI